MIPMPKKQLFLVRFSFVSNSGKISATIPVIDEDIHMERLRYEIYRKILSEGLQRNKSPEDIEIESITCYGDDILSNTDSAKP